MAKTVQEVKCRERRSFKEKIHIVVCIETRQPVNLVFLLMSADCVAFKLNCVIQTRHLFGHSYPSARSGCVLRAQH